MMENNTIPGLKTGIMNSFQTVMESIANARLKDTFTERGPNVASQQIKSIYAVNKPRTPREMSHRQPKNSSSRLHMGIIGCLPDNVQQALKSFSIKPGKQHMTIAFPFMVDMVQACSAADRLHINPRTDELNGVMFVCFGPEVVCGFRSLSTMVLDKERLCLTVAVFTLFEVNSIEGILRHFDSTVRMMVHSKTPITLWRHPVCVMDVESDLKESIISSMVETILDIQHENVQHSFPGKNRQELYLYLKEKVISQRFRSYEDHFHQCLTLGLSETTSSSTYRDLVGILTHIKDPRCTVSHFKKVNNYLKSSTPLTKTFWAIWGHEQISPKIFHAAKTAQDSRHRQLSSDDVTSQDPHHLRTLTVAQVSIKEGLKNIIDSLKHQETTDHKCVESDIESCSCLSSSEKTASAHSLPFAANGGSVHDRSAFHRPNKVKRHHHSTTPYSDALKAAAVSPYRLDSGSSGYTSHRRTQGNNRIQNYLTNHIPLHALYCEFFGTKYEMTNHLEPSSTNSL